MAFVPLILSRETVPVSDFDFTLPVSNLPCRIRRRSFEEVNAFLLKFQYGDLTFLMDYTEARAIHCIEAEGLEIEAPLIPGYMHAENNEMQIAALFCAIFSHFSKEKKIHVATFDEDVRVADGYTFRGLSSANFVSEIIRKNLFTSFSPRISARTGEKYLQCRSLRNEIFEIDLIWQR